MNLTILLLFAILSNIPLGYLREGVPKKSVRWFVYIHLSIPFIILLRTQLGFDWHIIPVTIGCAIVGQLFGGYLKRKSQAA